MKSGQKTKNYERLGQTKRRAKIRGTEESYPIIIYIKKGWRESNKKYKPFSTRVQPYLSRIIGSW